MKKIDYACALIFAFFWCSSSVFAMEPKSLQEYWDDENVKGYSPNDAKILQEKHVIFVAGFLNEMTRPLRNYFDDNMLAVEQLGGSYDYITPSSKLSIAENADILYNILIGIVNSIKRPIILFGHSAGGGQIMCALYKHPELILNGYVEKVLLIQAAIFGSPLVENESGVLYKIFSTILSPNTYTLSEQASRATFDTAFALYQIELKKRAKKLKVAKNDLHEVISSRIFWVRSSATKDYGLGLWGLLCVLQDDPDNYLEPDSHDVLLSLDAQYDPRIGRPFDTLKKVTHTDLTVSIVSNLSRESRQAFTRAAFLKMNDMKVFSINEKR